MDEATKISDAITIPVTELHEPSTGGLVLATRLTDLQLEEARAIAEAPLPALPICDERHLGQCLRVMRAALPRQNADDVSGELFVSAYQRKLGHLPKDQINFMADQALERCRWFPTIAECLEIASEWKRDDDAWRIRENARGKVLHEQQKRMEEAMDRLRAYEMTQAEFDALPERWQGIADARGLVAWVDGALVVRKSQIEHSLAD